MQVMPCNGVPGTAGLTSRGTLCLDVRPDLLTERGVSGVNASDGWPEDDTALLRPPVRGVPGVWGARLRLRHPTLLPQKLHMMQAGRSGQGVSATFNVISGGCYLVHASHIL